MERNQFFLDFSQKIAIGANEERMTKVKDGKNEVRRETYSLRKDYPLTQTQAGILTESLLQPDTTIYNIPMLYRISEKVDLQRLKSALEAAISKHPCLSATLFANDAGEYRTLRNDGAAPKVELIEVKKLPENLVQPFDLTADRLYRAKIYQTDGGSYLFLDFHHIIFDCNGLGILFQDINAAYAGETVAAEDYTGFDAALEEEKLRGGDRYAKAQAWYDALLSDADRDMMPDGDVDGQPRGAARYIHETELDDEPIKAFCKDRGIGRSVYFNAAFAFVLSRFTGKKDALYTTIHNGRDDSRLARTVTMLVKTFPVNISIDLQQRVTAYVSALAEQMAGSIRNDLFSFAEIAQKYGIASDIMFAYQGNGYTVDTIAGENAEFCPVNTDEAISPISFQVFKKGSRFVFECAYRSDIYSGSFIKTFALCVEKAAEAFLTKEKLGEIDLLTGEMAAMLDAFNATGKDYPVTDIVSLFRDSAAKHSGLPAVIFKDEALTYAQVDGISERIAGYLRSLGIGRGSVVSVLIPRNPYMATASLGVLKSGAAYQPLDPTYPSDRLTFMMQDAEAKLLIADETLLSKVPEYKGPVLLTKDIPALPACEPIAENPAPDDLFILLYTSGSTGTPKGVMLEHRNLANFCAWYREFYHLDASSRVAAYASYGFDANMMDLYPALTTGARVVIIEEEIRLDLMALEDCFSREGVTHSFMTTQVGRQFYSLANPGSLKYLSVGGEKLVPLPPKADGPILYNGYGPTECTIFTAAHRVDRLYERVPIGKPLDNCKCYVIDESGRRLPPFVPGELLIAGRGVGRGYLNRPDLTQKAFINNPFDTEEDYARAYRSGDVVRLLANGEIDFIGRNDGQVKVRGFRVELTEVEAVIREYPGIADATVQAFEDKDSGEKFIAAYVVSADTVDVSALNAFILERKPPYMVPAVTVQIGAIPLNQNQKVNKKALPAPEFHAIRKESGPAQAAPLNVLEKELKDMISEIVGTGAFGITDAFRDLGLSSISGIRLAVLLHKQYGVQLNARDLVSEGTLQRVENEILSAFLKRDDKPKKEKAESPNRPLSCRLSFAQQGVFADCQADPDAVRYNMPFALKFPAGIDAEQLKAAVLRVVDAHPYILCRFVPGGEGEIIQEPIPGVKLEIPILKMTEAELEAHKTAFVKPFDLAEGPCLRFEIVETDGLNLLVDMHHLVGDGASMDLFFEQLCQALDGKAIEKEQYSYYDYVADEKIAPEAEDYFAGRMAEISEATELIPDIFREGLPHTEKSVSVPTDISAVKAFAQQNGVTPAAVYLAASYIAYSRFVCEDTVAIATISNGRSNLNISETMGMFVNTLPLVMTLDHKEACLPFLRRAAKDFADTISHENYPFARIAAQYDFHPSASYTYQIGVINEYRTKRGSITVESLDAGPAKLPVGVYIEGTQDAARIAVNYDSALYSEEMMRSLAQSVENAVRGLLACERLSEISLTDEKQWAVLDGYNKPWDLNYDTADTVVSVFRRNAKAQPDKTAALFKEKAYTYRELDELTDRLAAKLYARACSVTGKTDLAEEVVSILIHRDENVFILPLAAVKAGLAYEPLDPSYPKERLNFMVKDAGACLLLAEEDLLNLVDEYDGARLTVRELYEMEDVPELPAGPKPEDLFIMLYTSGSTGTPKGCQIEHRNLVAYAYGQRNEFCTREDVIGAYASFGFDVNMEDVFCTLQNGGTVCLIPEEIRMNLGALAAYFDEAGVTALLMTTQVGVQFIQNYPKLKTLRLLIMGGEKLPALDPSRLSYTIANGYGPTENCCGVSMFPIRYWEPNIPIGKPSATIHGYVLDKTGHRLPAGAAGEYCLSGPQVTRGYLNRPDKTKEAYGPCPFNGFRMYHTGDIVRYRASGDVEFVGRKDGQVKIRGFRVETKEVEAVIRGFGGIRDVTVQAYDYEGGGKYLAAFVVSESAVDMDALRKFIKEQKPAYMVPAAIMQIDQIPLTVNQKVDKKALPKPALQKADYVAPQGKAEEDFCEIFRGVLGVERLGAEDDFFESGGSSILAMKVVIAAEKAGYGIVYNDVFTHTTPRALAAFASGGGEQPEAPAAEKAAAPQGDNALPEIGKDGYDYSRIHALLARNTMEAFRTGERLPLGDVLLLGGTGYLGSHVLRELICRHEGRLFCFVRPGKEESGEQRLKATLRAYFGDDCAPLFGSRITVIEGDATDPDALRGFQAPSENMTAINCAASVKHFAKGNEIERANVDSVRNLAAWCERSGARLVHISTCSVAGNRENDFPPESYRFDEHRLYAGQEIDSNQYVRSKFMAERHIYEEILERGLRAKVLRVANLAPRAEDGAFQINFRTNNFMNSIRAYQTLGMIQYDALIMPTEFSPIDWVAKSVLALACTPDECVCFMLMNPHRPLMGDIIRELNAIGYPTRGAEDEEVAQALRGALSDEKTSEAVGCLIAYNSNGNIKQIGLEGFDNTYTMGMLERLGVSWPETGSKYIRRFLENLARKGFFERSN